MARPSAVDADVAQILGLVRCFFAASPALPVWTTLDALRAAMLPQAVVTRTCGRSPAVYSVESFIAPRRPLLTDGSLTEERPGLGPDAHHQADGCL